MLSEANEGYADFVVVEYSPKLSSNAESWGYSARFTQVVGCMGLVVKVQVEGKYKLKLAEDANPEALTRR